MDGMIKGLVAGMLVSAVALVGAAQAAWPERPVTIIVPAGAGGGTDGTARLLAKQLQDELKQPFNVVNNGQGGGIVGHTQIGTARPDGYTLGIVYNYYQWKMLGQADINHTLYTPIALYNVDPSALIVADNSPFKTGKDAYDALKADGGKYKIGCGGSCGGSWHIPNAELFIKYGIDPKKPVMVPAAGAAASLQDLASGGLDMVMASLPRGQGADRGRQAAAADGDFHQPPGRAVPERPDLEGVGGHRLRGRRLPSRRRTQGAAGRHREDARDDPREDLEVRGVPERHEAAQLRPEVDELGADARVHEGAREGARRDDRGGRPREVAGEWGWAPRPIPDLMRLNEALLGAIFLALAIGMIAVAQGFHTPPGQKFGPGFFPTIIASVMGAAAIGLILKGFANRAGKRWVELDPWFSSPRLVLQGASVFVFLLIYLLLSEHLGFLVLAPILLWALICLLWGNPAWALLIALAASFVIHQFFVQVLLVPLPWGIVPYFKLF
jgi:tripartite-type tricarboxylate transporter receptor subunit TctC